MRDFESMYYELTNEIGNLPFGETYLDWIKIAKGFIIRGNEKQIAELQEMNKQSLEVINNLNEVVKIKSRDVLTARKETAEAKDKLHRRNLQIADLKKKIKDKVSINWVLKTLERWGFNDNEQGKRLIEDLKIYQTVNQ